MIQCSQCEYCIIAENGRKILKCDPFSNVKEPECLQKLQILRLDMLLASYRGMLRFQEKMGPVQDKLINYVEREIDSIEESEKWKYPDNNYQEDQDFDQDEDIKPT